MKNIVLLLYPKTGTDPIKPRMPSSLIYLGTGLAKEGYKPIIVDTRVDKDYESKINLYLNDTIAVGITTMTGMQINFAIKLAMMVRKLNSSIPIIWGGVHPSILSEQTIKSEYVDIIVRGEGDNIIIDLINAIKNNQPLDTIRSLTFKKEGRVVVTPDAELLDVNKLPAPNWRLIDPSKYRIFDVQSARGCPHRCDFCYNLVFNKRRWRQKDAEKVIAEIELILKEYNVTEINFIDDNFFTNRKRAEQMLNLIIEKGLNITWRTNCRANYFDQFDEDFLRLAYKAGLREVQIGCESGSQKILDYIKKDITLTQILNAIAICKNAGIQAQCSFMIGIPIETEEDNLMTFDLIDKLRKIDPNVLINMIAIYTPYPGAPLFERAKEFGFKAPESLSGWGNFSYTFVNVPWIKGFKKMRYEGITYISRFLFFKNELRKKFITPLLSIPFEILCFDAWIRWKLRFFALPLEWMAVKYFLLARRAKQFNGSDE